MNNEQENIKEDINGGGSVTFVFLAGVIAGLGLMLIAQLVFPTNLTLENETLMNESFTNGTQLGYHLGVWDTSNYAIQTGSLPLFNVTGDLIGHLNLTKYYKEDKNGK